MSIVTKFNQFMGSLGIGVHTFTSNQLNVMLTNTQPSSAYTEYSQLTEIGAGNGYSTGGTQCTLGSWSQVNGLWTLILNNATFTASGGSIGPFRYVVLYNETAVSANPSTGINSLIQWWDYLSNISILSGNSWTTDFDATNGVLQLQ